MIDVQTSLYTISRTFLFFVFFLFLLFHFIIFSFYSFHLFNFIIFIWDRILSPFSTFDEDIWIESDSTEARIPQLVNEIVMRISEDVFMDIYATFHPSPTPALPPLAMIPPTLSTLITVKPALLHAKPCKPYKPRPRPFSSRPLLPIPVVVETFSPPSMSSKPFLFHPFLPPLSAPHSTRPCSSRRFPSSAARPTEVDVFERVTSARTGRKIPSLYHHY
ncbi:hypothetical protein HMI55_006226 [Coelomomyces lativittatus]|nr:hypothetical protein HMI55_006226 [Coelomomyces lativittatus]